MISTQIALAALTVVAASAPTHAAVTISSDATQNMNCQDGDCVPTATKAVLNASDLETYLSQYGNVHVTTTGSGVEAENIIVHSAFAAPNSTSLTLQAHKAITVDAAVSIGSGTAELELQSDTNDALHTLSFGKKGRVTFASLSDIFGINGGIFTLVHSVRSLASAIAGNPSGFYALAHNYDASRDGTYETAPISTTFDGIFEGLGNTISNLSISTRKMRPAGFFAAISSASIVRDIGIMNASISSSSRYTSVGALVSDNGGTIINSWASGTVTAIKGTSGGLVGYNYGTVAQSHAGVAVIGSDAGGLVGMNSGQIMDSYATGAVPGVQSGGLVGDNEASISDSYATGSVSTEYSNVGGLVGSNGLSATIIQSYSTGEVSCGEGHCGGLIGFDDSPQGSLSFTYWDTDSSGITNLSQGAGSPTNDPGITGLTTEQFQSGLPTGFDPKIWAEDPNINNGLPYLIANPPPK